MKKNFIQLLLLCSLFFNVAHASIIAIEDECHTSSVHDYILEQNADSECGDLCDMHHLFHFMAIVDTPKLVMPNNFHQEKYTHKVTFYNASFKETNIKPPIA